MILTSKDFKETECIEELIVFLENANAISFDSSIMGPIHRGTKVCYTDMETYSTFTIDYVKLAQAIYDGGYRKHEQKDRV